MSRIVTKITFIGICLLALPVIVLAQSGATARAGNVTTQPVSESDRSRDGLIGPVRRVRTEVAKLVTQEGKQVESKHVVLEIVAYDVKGNKIENQYFPIAGATLTGKEVYKYDERGNISEMTLLNTDGTLLSKEVYKYEYDFAGNWNKMTTAVAVTDGGRISFEPSEITYRSIMYYLDDSMMKMVNGGTPTSSPAPTSSANTAATTETTTAANKPPTRPVVEPKQPKNRMGDSRRNAPATVSPTLPAPNMSSTRLSTSGAVEARTLAVNSTSNVPMVNLSDEPPPSPAPKPMKPVSGGVLNGTAISLPAPTYPESAKRMKTQGIVTVEVVLDETGKVISAAATSGPPMLRDAAVQAAKRARFSPTKLSGMPVKVSGTINYKFALVQ